jgi:hypothetical protein
MVKEALPAAAEGKPIEIWFQDEGYAQPISTSTALLTFW